MSSSNISGTRTVWNLTFSMLVGARIVGIAKNLEFGRVVWGLKSQKPRLKAKSGGEVLGEGQWVLNPPARVSPPAGFGAEPWPQMSFWSWKALKMLVLLCIFTYFLISGADVYVHMLAWKTWSEVGTKNFSCWSVSEFVFADYFYFCQSEREADVRKHGMSTKGMKWIKHSKNNDLCNSSCAVVFHCCV